jgi:hypothetical protein
MPIADWTPKLEIGNWKSAMSLPTRLNNARNLSQERQLSKTDAAQIELAQIAAWTTTTLAAGISADSKLRSAVRFRNQ